VSGRGFAFLCASCVCASLVCRCDGCRIPHWLSGGTLTGIGWDQILCGGAFHAHCDRVFLCASVSALLAQWVQNEDVVLARMQQRGMQRQRKMNRMSTGHASQWAADYDNSDIQQQRNRKEKNDKRAMTVRFGQPEPPREKQRKDRDSIASEALLDSTAERIQRNSSNSRAAGIAATEGNHTHHNRSFNHLHRLRLFSSISTFNIDSFHQVSSEVFSRCDDAIVASFSSSRVRIRVRFRFSCSFVFVFVQLTGKQQQRQGEKRKEKKRKEESKRKLHRNAICALAAWDRVEWAGML
jgi:hypothetical protein